MKKKSFTLMELLIVIAIIGILATVVIVSLGSARARSRNARRINDLAAIKTAVELYKDTNGSYEIKTKDGLATGHSAVSSWGYFNSKSSCDGNYQTNSIGDGLVSWGYFNPAPVDPQKTCGVGSYMFFVPTGAAPKDKYCIYAKLENGCSPAPCWDTRSSSAVPGGNPQNWAASPYLMNYRVGNGC